MYLIGKNITIVRLCSNNNTGDFTITTERRLYIYVLAVITRIMMMMIILAMAMTIIVGLKSGPKARLYDTYHDTLHLSHLFLSWMI
jgi:hypothetical protein